MLSEHLEILVSSDSTICAYVPVGTEPGSIAMLDMLLRKSARVLLPVARTAGDDTPLPLRWGEYRRGGLNRGRWGLLEPAEPSGRAAGPGPLLLRSLAGRPGPECAPSRDGARRGVGRRVAGRPARCADDPCAHATTRADRPVPLNPFRGQLRAPLTAVVGNETAHGAVLALGQGRVLTRHRHHPEVFRADLQLRVHRVRQPLRHCASLHR
jgi:hypothetical protein